MRQHRTHLPTASALLLAALACGVPERASAQCGTSCNQLATHWEFGQPKNTTASFLLGMVCSGTICIPVLCDQSTQQIAGWVDRAYSTARTLTEDTSMCFGNGSQSILMLGPTLVSTCYWDGQPVAVLPFTGGGHTFSVSLEGGADDFSTTYQGDLTVCGGPGNDRISTNLGYLYAHAGGGDDYVDGGAHYDNIRGGLDGDTLAHTQPADADKLRGDEGNDCLAIFAPSFSAESSCGPGSNDAYRDGGGGRPESCEKKVSGCPIP